MTGEPIRCQNENGVTVNRITVAFLEFAEAIATNGKGGQA